MNGDSLIIKALWSLDLLSGLFTFRVVSIWQLQKRKVLKTCGTFQTLIHYNSKIIFWDFKRWELSAIAFKGLVGERCRNSHVVFAYRIGISSAYKWPENQHYKLWYWSDFKFHDRSRTATSTLYLSKWRNFHWAFSYSCHKRQLRSGSMVPQAKKWVYLAIAKWLYFTDKRAMASSSSQSLIEKF